MDERHWWIASKVEQTFCIDKSSPIDTSFTESFFRRPDVLDKINSFLVAKGSNKLFFYTTRERLHAKDITCCQTIVDEYALINEPLDNIILLFFLRSDTSSDATISPVSDIYCGEIKHAAQMTSLLYSQTLLPLFKRELSASAGDTYQQAASKTAIVTQMEKNVDALSATCNSLQKDKNTLLKRADAEMISQLKQSARSTVDSPVIRTCEPLVLSWIASIESVLQDIFGEDPMHPSLGPMSEIERWTRKQRLITNLLEQLKSKECKAVIGALITSKSKVIRKWKAIDTLITEAQNECRDKTKFLESIRRHLEGLTDDAHPQNCAVNILPALCDSMRTVESVSRYYARQGYLGLIFSKVTNQLVKICKHHINDDLTDLWPVLFGEIQLGGMIDDIRENFHLDKRDVKRFREVPKSAVPLETDSTNESTFQRLKNCLLLLACYKDTFRALRDALGGAQMLTSTAFSATSSSSLSGTTSTNPRDQSHHSRQMRQTSGILMSEDERIFEYLDEFCRRVEQMLDMTVTLNQFSQLISTTIRLPRPKREDFQEAETVLNRAEVPAIGPAENGIESTSDEGIDDADSESGTNITDYLISSVSKFDLELMRKHFAINDDSVTMSALLADGVNRLKSILITKSSSNEDDKTKFDAMHKQFVDVTRELEQLIGAYANVVFSKTKRTQEGLTILASFEPICERHHLRSILRDAYVNLFLNFENDLLDIRTTFEAHKDDPPLPRNAPPVPGAIAWSRTLLTKIEEAMDVFKINRHIVTLGNFPLISKLYNRTAKALLVYEQLLLTRWKEKIEAWKDHLNANLLCLINSSDDEDTKQIAINSNIELFSIFDEVKWFKRLDVDIPKAALVCMQKEESFKHYKSLLADLLSRFHDLQLRIYPPFYSLFTGQLSQVHRAMEPGLHTLTWSSLNIDAYIAKVHRALDRFETSISNVNTLIAQKIDHILDDELMNPTHLLLSLEFVRSKLWSPGDFLNAMRAHLHEKAIAIGKQLFDIQQTFQEVDDMLKSTGVIPNVQKSRSSTSSTRRTKTATPAVTSEALLAFIRYYYDKMNRCVHKIIERTLTSFIELACVNETKYLIDETKLIRFLFEGQDIDEQMTAMDTHRIRIGCTMQYAIPEITIDPQLHFCQKCISDVAQAIIDCERQISEAACYDAETARRLSSIIHTDSHLTSLCNRLSSIDIDVNRITKSAIQYIRTFDFLWRDDMQSQFRSVLEQNENDEEQPSASVDSKGIPSAESRALLHGELERLVKIEQRLDILPSQIQIGCICIETLPIINSLRTFAFSWKTQYAKLLHAFAKQELDQVVAYRQQVQSRFNDDVSTLEQLDEALTLLEELSEMENKIDAIYLPIETTYALLDQTYNIRIPRDELSECSQLRDKWSDLMSNADRVRRQLLQERRQQLEQELDKQVKSFVVEVIRFRNAFDVEGPNVPDLSPLDAAKRLKDFQAQYKIMHKRKQTLNSISTLFNLQPKQFPELDKTGEELLLLDQLYILYKKFIAFDTTFRATLWSEVDLTQSKAELNQLWSEFCDLPSKLQERIWTAYFDLEAHLKKYLQLLPLLFMLNAREIRSRHWLKVMQITGCSFQLESTIFKLNDLLDIFLDKYQNAIGIICFSAQKELELEIKMRSIEEEWTEQILNFEPYKDYGSVLLEKRYVEHLLEHLEDGEETLAQMLTTRYIEPMREEVASWSEKLKTIGEILELWLEVQDMWLGAENIFNNPSAAKDIALEAKRFARVDKTWLKTQRQSVEIRNVLQCCLNEPPKKGILKEIHKELEICNKSISLYLDRKRQIFPRFFFVTNRSLISILSRQDTIDYVKPQFKAMFNGIRDLKLIVSSVEQIRTTEDRRGTINSESRSHADFIVITHHDIVQVLSDDGECMPLRRPIPLAKSVEHWLSRLQESVAETIRTDIIACLKDIDGGLPFEELVSKYTCQVSLVGLLYAWTREVEAGIIELRNDRKGLNNASKRFAGLIAKIPTALTRLHWRSPTQPVLPLHKLRLDGLLAFAAYLRDNFDLLCSRRREMSQRDFDWRRCFRVYQHLSSSASASEQKQQSTVMPAFSGETVRIQVLDDIFLYGGEFHGIRETLSITPASEKCFLAIWLALSFKRPVLVQGNTAVGKTYTITSFARFLGRFVATFECSQYVDAAAASMFMTGLASDGCWGILHNIHLLSANVLSPLAEYITLISNALRSGISATTIPSESKEIPIKLSAGIMATHNPFATNPSGSGRVSLPSEIRSRFRIISLVKPDVEQIIRIKCFEHNFKNVNIIAEKLGLLYESIRMYLPIEQRSIISLAAFLDILAYVNNQKKRHSSRPNSMTSAASKIDDTKRPMTMKTNVYGGVKSDQFLVAQALIDVIGARLNPENAKTFRIFVVDIFVGRDENKLATFNTTGLTLDKIISDKAPDRGLVPNKLWVDKCTQMIYAASVSRNMVLCGSAHSGKSSAALLMIDILTQMQQQQQQQSQTSAHQQKNTSSSESNYAQEIAAQTHKLYRINPLAIESESIFLGYITLANEWQDGILTSMLRTANRNCHTSWICFDGTISETWADLIPSIMDKEPSLQIRNGDKLFLLDQVKFMFETLSLSDASPAFITNSTIVYFDKSIIDWKIIAGAWLKDRRQMEIQSLQNCFEKVMDPVMNFLKDECSRTSYYSETSLFSISLKLLDAILRDSSHVTTDVHVERLFVFCLTFVLKAILNVDEQKRYSDLLKTLVTVLPDDDREISVFDYYVDESCEWDLWTAKVEELNENIHDRIDVFGNVLVQTVDLARAQYFLKYATLAQVNLLLTGTTGSCKSSLLDAVLSGLDQAQFLTARLNFSMATNSADLQKFIEGNVVHRQGFTYGAPLAKKFCLFIDDIQAASHSGPEKFKNAPEFLRSLIDHHQFSTQQKPYETRIIDDFFVFAAATIPSTGELSSLSFNPRLLRHFAIINLPSASGGALRQILSNVIEVNMMAYGKTPINQDITSKIVDVLTETLLRIQRTLQPCSTTGREHYLFSLRQMMIAIQSLRRLDAQTRTQTNSIAPFLKHELHRIIGDQLVREIDHYWFTDTLDELFRNIFDWDKKDEENLYFTFPLEGRSYERPLNAIMIKEIKVQVQPVESINHLRKAIDQVAMRYREEFGHHTFSLAVSENIALHIIRMHRILAHSALSNLLVIGMVGSHLSKLVRLAFYLAEIQEHVIDHATKSLFYDSLRAVIRTTAVEGRHVGVLLTVKHLRDTDLIDTLSSLLTSCECPHLFSRDEVDGLYQAVINAHKRDQNVAAVVITDPRRYFLSRIRQNLHIAICLPAHSDLLGRISGEYPGLLKHTQVYWVKNWSPISLHVEASFFLASRDILIPDDLRHRLSQCLCDIHHHMLTESRQMPFVGSTDRQITVREYASHSTRTGSSKEIPPTKKLGTKEPKEAKMVDLELPNYPYSRMLMYEQIKAHGSNTSMPQSQLHAFLGPETFLRFMQSFWYLFTSKAVVCERDIIRLNKVLSTLNKTRADAEQMREYIRELKDRCRASEEDTAVLLEQVVLKSMILEKFKAKTGLPGSLPGYTHREEKDEINLPEEERRLLADDQTDEYEENFKRMKEESLRSRQAKMQEEYEEALREVDKWRERLGNKRKEVEFWMGKVDKSCIERIRAFQTPPTLIGQIMEMILTLIGRRPAIKNDSKDPDRDKGTRGQAERLDRNQWKQYTSLMADSGRFVEMLHGVNWHDGLNLDVANAVESYIAKGRDGISEGVSGEGSLLDNAKGFYVAAARNSASQENRITIAGARYASEEAAALVHYVIALIEYTKLCQPLRLAKHRVEKLKQDLIDAEQKQLEKESEIQRLKVMEASLHSDVNEVDHRMVDISQYTIDDLPKLISELEEVQNQFDAAAVNKSKLKKEYDSCLLRLQAAVNVTQSIFEMDIFDVKQRQQRDQSNRPDDESVCLSDLEDQWTKWITEHSTHEQTLTNCILAAAYMAYCSPFDADLRRILCQKFLRICEQYEIPKEADLIFQPIPIDTQLKGPLDLPVSLAMLSGDMGGNTARGNRTSTIALMTLAEFLYNPIELKEFQLLRLIPTDILTENGCVIMADAGLNAWPLICDATWYSIEWVRLFLKNKQLLIVRYHQLRTQLETALSEGHHLLLTDCDPQTIMANEKLETVIRNQARFVTSEKPFKLQIGQQEIECSPKFRLYMHTISTPIRIPKELAAYTLTLCFHMTLNDLEEIFLTRFMIKEKPHIDAEQYILLQEKVDTLKIIDPLRQNITNFLASDTLNLLHSLEPTKRLSDLKKSYDEAIEGSHRVATQEESLFKTRNSYRKLAQRAATCYNIMHYLRQLAHEYVMPLEHFIDVFDACIFQSEKHSMGTVMTELTKNAFITIYRTLNDRDRRVFAIYFAMEIEAFNRRQHHNQQPSDATGEREFIVSPAWAINLLQKKSGRVPSEHRFSAYKKPFDWMTDEAFQNLQYLGIFFDWFADGFERLAKEGQETKWRPLCEGETEHYPLPPPLEQLEPIQKFCIVRALRSDRILQASTVYVTNVFHQDSNKTKSLAQDNPHHQSSISSPPVAASSRPTTIPVIPTLNQDADLLTRQCALRSVLLCYDDEPDEVVNFFLYCTNLTQPDPTTGTPSFQVVHVYGNGANEERILKKTFTKALTNNVWLLLHCVHKSPSFLAHVETSLWDLRSKRTSPSMPRIWLSIQRTYPFPSSLYNLCLIAYIRTPLSMKEAMTRAFALIDTDLLRHSSKPEWVPLLHNICYVHCALNLRTRFGQAGWDLPSLTSFTNVELSAAFQVVAREFALSDQAIPRLESAHTSSGGSSEVNVRQLSWSSIKYALSELIYGARTLSEYDQRAVSNIIDFWIQPGSVKKDFEFTKIKYKIPAAFFGQQPKLNQLQQALESLSTHQLDAPEACHLHSTFETNLGDDVLIINRLNRILDALPPTISLNAAVFQRPYTPVEDVTINTSITSLAGQVSFSSAALYSFSTRKTIALEEYCAMVLATKLPKVLTKDQILDRARRNGSPLHSPFNIWIMREAQLMHDLVTLIRTHLQAIKAACDLNQLGAQWPIELANVAHSLYYQRIPDAWCEAIGPSAPLPNWGLNNLFNDLSIRAEHIEKVLNKGRDKHPAYNLSAFFHASSLFGIFKQEVAHALNLSDDVNNGSLVFQCELTPRDREHIREPPKDGLFIFGLYLWGCNSDKNAVEHGILDVPTRNRDACSSLPVIHLSCVSAEKAALLTAQQQAAADSTSNSRTTVLDIYSCPVFCKRSTERRPNDVVCEFDLWKKTSNVGQGSRWAWRGICMTVKPY